VRLKNVLLILLALSLAATAWAQTKTSGTLQCGKSDPSYQIPVGDRPDHVFSIGKAKCTWSTALEMAGTQSKDHESASFADIRGARGQVRTADVGTMANGDKYFVSTQGTTTVKEGVTQTYEGTWRYTGGTGKLKGLKGKGTFKGKAGADGAMTVEVEGEYQLPK
jgi:hypothetical protein